MALPYGYSCVKQASAKTIHNHLRALRFAHNEMSQQQLAERVGVTRQTIIAIERGKYSPSLEVAFKIADVLGLPLAEVFSYG